MRKYLLSALVLVSLAGVFSLAEEPAKDKPVAQPDNNVELMTLSGGERVYFRILSRDDKTGQPKDKKIEKIEIDGILANPNWPLEFYACADGSGKEHETLIIMNCKPQNLHLGLILMGLTEEPDERSAKAFGDPTPPGGDLVLVDVSWTKDDKTVTYRAEDIIISDLTGRPMTHTGWAFTGSKFIDEIDYDTQKPTGRKLYQANYSKTIMATWHDSSAILNDPTCGGHYMPYKEILPERGTKVVVTLRVPDAKDLVELKKNIESAVKEMAEIKKKIQEQKDKGNPK